MTERPKGNILYEILIAVLVIVLIGTILYPKKTWKKEAELERVCQTRMETIQHLEIQFLFNQNTYSDSVTEVIENIMTDPGALMALDSLVKWDGLVAQNELKQMFAERSFPEDLRAHIQNQLIDRKPLGGLANWDDLEYKLLELLKETLHDSTATPDSLDKNVIWPLLFGEATFFDLIENAEMSRRVQQRSWSAINRGTSVTETDGWRYVRPSFVSALEKVIQGAESKDIWKKADKDEWEEERRITWESALDTLSEADQDTLWQENRRGLWDKRKELVWMKDRVKLWKSEGEIWALENLEMWKRVMDEQWEKERKREWLKKDGENLPDSLKLIFSTKKDSLWRTVVNDIREKDFEKWSKKNREKVIQGLWENDRRLTWEKEKYIQWTEQKELDKTTLWKDLKEELWKLQKDYLWRDEEMKASNKRSALRKLDVSISWADVLGEERVSKAVQNLQLPDNNQLLKMFKNTAKTRTKTRGSALNDLGLASIFRDQLIEQALSCPVALSPYLIVVPDSLSDRVLEIHCPISDTSRTTHIIQIDPITKDTSTVDLKTPLGQKLFGGAKIKNHGYIDRDGKKSWTKKGQ